MIIAKNGDCIFAQQRIEEENSRETLYSLYDKPYYYLWRDSNVTPLLPASIKNIWMKTMMF
jgi:hypothetical protein